jgi:hypothetical protein
MIFTTKGEMDEAQLEKRYGSMENANEEINWIEYWHENELVHRSVHVTLKRPIVSFAEIEGFNG